MKVLVACEFSGRVREAFRNIGHEAWSCDLLPADDGSPFHHQGNVLEFAKTKKRWDLIIAHPPCTYLANSGVRWLYEGGSSKSGKFNAERYSNMEDAAVFFNYMLTLNGKRIAVENPIPHKFALQNMLRPYDQIVQPWMFGHPETKATCLWLKGLPKLKPTKVVIAMNGSAMHKLPPSKDRWKKRSMTYEGIARAMADQWG